MKVSNAGQLASDGVQVDLSDVEYAPNHVETVFLCELLISFQDALLAVPAKRSTKPRIWRDPRGKRIDRILAMLDRQRPIFDDEPDQAPDLEAARARFRGIVRGCEKRDLTYLMRRIQGELESALTLLKNWFLALRSDVGAAGDSVLNWISRLQAVADLERPLVSRLNDLQIACTALDSVIACIQSDTEEEFSNEYVDTCSSRAELQPKTFSINNVREMTGFGGNSLNRYAKAAGISTPRRGKKDYRYPEADTIKLLQHVIDKSTESRIVQKCRAALEMLTKITE